MHAEYFVVDECGDGQLIKHANELLKKPAIFLVRSRQLQFGLALPLKQRLVKAVNVRKALAFVIASKQEEILWILNFKGK